jgi:UDP-N-acetylglucosamine 2-epimerase (non-hydrolysing)
MKVAPLLHAAASQRQNPAPGSRPIHCVLVHTGQHYDAAMSGVFFRELGIPQPDYNLEVGSGSHAVQTANIMIRFEPALEKERPDWVVVVGDVNSTVACTLVAAKMGIKVAHIEAGLRSFDRSMPEETNRLVTDAISDLLLPPSEDAVENLRREGIPPERIKLVGNIMIDSLIANLSKSRSTTILETLGIQPGNFAYVTLHRPANVDDKESLRRILEEFSQISRSLPIVFPIHPRTRQRIASFGLESFVSGQIKLIDPLGYHESLRLAECARLVITDSGGLQEETTYFQTPCLTLRPNTERPVTVTSGSNRLATLGTLSSLIQEALACGGRRGAIPPLWDGKTAVRILDELQAASGAPVS